MKVSRTSRQRTKTRTNQEATRSETKPKSEKLDFGKCKVCKDKATGIHYGIPSCEGCKGFYKRSIGKHGKYVCHFGSKCSVTPRQRRRCKLCRWKLCIQAGMSLDSIKMGRISKADKEKVKKQIETDTTLSVNEVRTIAKPSVVDVDNLNLPKEFREQCYKAFCGFTAELNEIYQKALECLKINKPEPLPADEIDQNTIQMIWTILLQRIGENTQSIVYYVKSLPGFSQLDVADLASLFQEHTSMLLGLRMSRFFIGGEIFYFINQNIRMTRNLMARLMGKAVQERIFGFHENFNELKLTDRELSLLMPAIISYVDEDMQLKNPDQVLRLHEHYKIALRQEFEQHRRGPEFLHKLVQTLKQAPIRRQSIMSNIITNE